MSAILKFYLSQKWDLEPVRQFKIIQDEMIKNKKKTNKQTNKQTKNHYS